MKAFVLVYDRSSGALRYEEFPEGHRREAFSRRSKLQSSAGPETEVVVLHAEEFEDLRSTHSRYFDDAHVLLRKFEAPKAS